MRDSSQFGWSTTAAEVAAGIDLHGKTVLITGGSSGLGQEAARILASCGAEIVLTARDVPKGQAVADQIRSATGNVKVSVESLELGSLENIRAFASRFLAAHPKLNLLINNAGVMACPLQRTSDGFEMQFGSNHLGHFLLTCLLAPALLRGAPGRIVNLSSRGHHFGGVDFDDPNFERRPYDKWQSYGQSKTANVLFAVGLEKRLGAKGVHAYAVHPGAIVTELGRHLSEEDISYLLERTRRTGSGFKNVEAGAATTVFAATAPELEGRGGLYLEDCHVAEINNEEEASSGVRSYALDPGNADRLWELSERLTGGRLAI